MCRITLLFLPCSKSMIRPPFPINLNVACMQVKVHGIIIQHCFVPDCLNNKGKHFLKMKFQEKSGNIILSSCLLQIDSALVWAPLNTWQLMSFMQPSIYKKHPVELLCSKTFDNMVFQGKICGQTHALVHITQNLEGLAQTKIEQKFGIFLAFCNSLFIGF